MGHLEESSMLSVTSPLVWLVRDVVGEVCLSRSMSASCRIEVELVIELTRGCVESSKPIPFTSRRYCFGGRACLRW